MRNVIASVRTVRCMYRMQKQLMKVVVIRCRNEMKAHRTFHNKRIFLLQFTHVYTYPYICSSTYTYCVFVCVFTTSFVKLCDDGDVLHLSKLDT